MGIKTKVTTPDNFAKTFSYEVLMKRAFNASDNQKLHIHRSNMENLLAAEIRRVEQLERVREYIDSALDRLIARNTADYDMAKLEALKDKVQNASFSHELMHIINEALFITDN